MELNAQRVSRNRKLPSESAGSTGASKTEEEEGELDNRRVKRRAVKKVEDAEQHW